MVTVRILGGLGNQLFQYALGRCLSLKKKEDLLLDYYQQIIRTDFDGENFLKNTSGSKSLNTDDLEKYAPNIVNGISKLKEWSKSL